MVGTAGDAGAVGVLYGSSLGLQAVSPDDQYITQDSLGVKHSAEPADNFGWSLAAGDFNADGFADLAIGDFAENLEGTTMLYNAGRWRCCTGRPRGCKR